MLRRLTLVLVFALAALLGLASPAWAHVELEPAEATSGSTETLTFHVAYEGAATTGLDVRLPEGASVVEVPEKAGWTSNVDQAERTVSWSGGSVEDDETFSMVVALPTMTGEVLFPAVQLTTAGEVAWIDQEEDDDHEGHPAPRLTLIADPNATTTTESETTTTAVTTTTADLPGTTLEAANEGDGDDAAPWLIGAGIAALVAIVIGGMFLKRRADADKARGAEAPAGQTDAADAAPPSDAP
jgi:periplasmic copper chaperone A